MGKRKQAKASSASSTTSRPNKKRRRSRRRNDKLLVSTQAPPSISLPDDVLEEIFLRLPMKSLIRLKSLSKHWSNTIECSRSFAEKHLEISEKSHPRAVMVITEEKPFINNGKRHRPDTDIGFATISLESASLVSFTLLNLPQGLFHWVYASESCDGLFCIHTPKTTSIYVVNPATRWLRQLPPARFQITMQQLYPDPGTYTPGRFDFVLLHLAFVKCNGYKLVWLYNNDDPDDDGVVTKCEVFDFRANAWRYLPCTPSYRVFHHQKPAYANGSVYWLTEAYKGEIRVVSLDVGSERFRFLPKLRPGIASSDPSHVDMCTLDGGLCMSRREVDTMVQEIWRLKSSKEEDTWEKIYTIDLLSCASTCRTRFRDGFDWSHKDFVEPSTPVAICKSKEILLSHPYTRNLVKHDPQTKSLSLFSQERPLSKRKVLYFPTLISLV